MLTSGVFFVYLFPMPTVTSTIHPLPFHHLEPKRFEDLVRQLSYEFRPWRALEATGTGGADDNFDIRGWEVVGGPPQAEEDEDVENTDEPHSPTESDRLWLIQCKRETEIGPTKLAKYVDDIPEEEAKKLYGVIIAASCTLSKKARDTFREGCIARGYQECYLWSRSELEDMLFQPKHDGLLFAYFGFSLTLRRRAVASKLRMRLTAKRKVIRAFNSPRYIGRDILIVDVNSNYPYRDSEKDPFRQLTWRCVTALEHYSRGIILELFRFNAYIAPDLKGWDVAPFVDEAHRWDDLFWTTREERAEYLERLKEVQEFMDTLDPQTRADGRVSGYLPYERIIDIDTDGDVHSNCPILYMEFEKPDRLGLVRKIDIRGRWNPPTDDTPRALYKPPEIEDADEADLLKIFPEHMRDMK